MQQSDHDIRNRLLIARLPAMPQILIKLIAHLQADDLGMPELAKLISNDPGMTSKMLAVANSSAYHRGNRSADLEQSLVALGTDMIKTLVISESVFQTFNSFPHSSSTDLRAFWKHSLTAAVIARDLARRSAYPQPEEAYLAGLLHNVGRLALLATAPKEYAFNFGARDDEELCAVEQRTLQITHSEAGAWLIERWSLDSFLADSVLYHHEPVTRLASAHPLIRIVRLAHLLASHELDDINDATTLCGLDAADVESVVSAAARQVDKAAEHLGIDIAGAEEMALLPPAYTPPPPVDPVQQRLSEEVRNMMLVSEVSQSLARQQGESGLVEAMTRSARILFDFDKTAILMENPTGRALVGMPTPDLARIAEFTIALDAPGPIAASAHERRIAIIGAGPDAGLAEEQLLRMLGTEAMVCLPLVAGHRCLGVIVGGVQGWQVPHCQQRERFMQAFGAQAAIALETAMSERGHAKRQLAHQAEEYREASRRVAHEVNNPLSIIKNYLSVLDHKLARQEPVVGELSILNEEIDRVGNLIGSLADLQPASSMQGADVSRVVGEVQRLFKATDFLPPSVHLLVDLPPGPSEIEGDADILKQILVNLIKNAVEALHDGGKVEVRNRGLVNRERKLYLDLVVSDNGPGMSTEVLANLFAPVRSNKAGPNHGLGLSIVHSLVKKMNGLISCRSNTHGTSFEILLPARTGSGSALGAPARAMDPV